MVRCGYGHRRCTGPRQQGNLHCARPLRPIGHANDCPGLPLTTRDAIPACDLEACASARSQLFSGSFARSGPKARMQEQRFSVERRLQDGERACPNAGGGSARAFADFQTVRDAGAFPRGTRRTAAPTTSTTQ